MNTKLFLITVVALVALLAGILSTFGLGRSSSVKAQEQVVARSSISVENESSVRMWSGPIQFNDANSPDFRPHAQTSAKPGVATECISDESIQPRRWGGCIQ